MIPSVLMTRSAEDAPPPPQAASVTLTDLPHLTPQQIANLPAAELARLQQEADAALHHAKSVVASLGDALDHRYGQRARQARAAQAKDTGKRGASGAVYLCVKDMLFQTSAEELNPETGEIEPVVVRVLPTDFMCPQTGALLTVENPDVWVDQEEV